MNIIEVAEFLSAYAALMTVFLAFAELSSRAKTKKADTAMSIYADYLYVAQQISYLMGSAESFSEKCGNLTAEQMKAYAKTHMAEKSLFGMIHRIENESVSGFNYQTEEGKSNSQVILSYVGQANNLLTFLNTFYQSVLDEPNPDAEFIRQTYAQLEHRYNNETLASVAAGELLKRNLKKLRNNSNAYLICLFVAGFVLLVLCHFLKML